MTEAQKCLYHIAENMRMDKSISKEGYEYFQQAIKALEQESCEDCVNRQAVLNTLFYKSDNNCEVVLNKELQDRIKALPSVTPQPKTGYWINAYPDIEPNPMFMYGICSVCGFKQSISNKLNYCPNCGAKMEVEE